MSADRGIDPSFAYLSENLLAYTDLTARLVDTEAGVAMWVEELAVDTPIELEVRVREDGTLALGIAPPLYPIELGVEPVLHRMRFVAVAEETDEVPPDSGDRHG